MRKCYRLYLHRRLKNLPYRELPPAAVEAYAQQWFNRIVPRALHPQAEACLCRLGDGGYLWHIFSFNL